MRFTPFFLLFSALWTLCSAEDKQCTLRSGNHKYYDLNSLRDSKDYEMKTFGGQTLVLNVCGGVHRYLFGYKEAEEPAGFIRRGHGDFSIGKVNQTLTLTESGPRLILTEGSQCKTSSDETIENMRASTVIDFICDMSAFGTGKPRLVAQLPPNDENTACAFYFEWTTHYACATIESSVWGFFNVTALLVIVLVLAYTILGSLYNRFILQLRGYDQIPQFSLESMKYHAHEAIDWFRDIMTILYENSQRRGGYDDGLPFRRPGGNPNAPNPFSHFTQSNDGNEFVRPQANRAESTRRYDINPVSHQSQVQFEPSVTRTSLSETPSSSPPPPPQKDVRSIDQDTVQNSTLEEKQRFMLEDEEEEETGQEMSAMSTSSSHSPREAQASTQ